MADIAARTAEPTGRGSMAFSPPAAATGGGSAVVLLLAVLLIPNQFAIFVGDVLFTPLRIYLIIFGAVAAARLASGRFGLATHDLLYFAFAGWTALCILINRGLGGGIQPAGQFVLETAVLYAVVLTSMTRREHFDRLVKAYIVIVAVLTPLAVLEALSGTHILLDFADRLVGRRPMSGTLAGERLGLTRVTSVFEHPILYGVFCAGLVGYAWYLANGVLTGLARIALLLTATFLSLSSAPLLVAMLQVAFIAAERATRGAPYRGYAVFAALAAFIVLVQAATSRGIFGVVMLLTFSGHNTYYRREIWHHGQDDVLRSPVFGLNPENWTRAFWMTPSIDNFWLFQAMLGGLPSVAFLSLAILLIGMRLYREPDAALPAAVRPLRRGWLYGAVAMILAGMTTHYYGKLQPLFSLYIALGAAIVRVMATAPRDPAAADGAATARRPAPALRTEI